MPAATWQAAVPDMPAPRMTTFAGTDAGGAAEKNSAAAIFRL